MLELVLPSLLINRYGELWVEKEEDTIKTGMRLELSRKIEAKTIEI